MAWPVLLHPIRTAHCIDRAPELGNATELLVGSFAKHDDPDLSSIRCIGDAIRGWSFLRDTSLAQPYASAGCIPGEISLVMACRSVRHSPLDPKQYPFKQNKNAVPRTAFFLNPKPVLSMFWQSLPRSKSLTDRRRKPHHQPALTWRGRRLRPYSHSENSRTNRLS